MADPGYRRRWSLIVAALVALGAPGAAWADEALVAVASNFARVARELEARFEGAGDHSITIVNGSTGKLYAQIVNGAPYDVFLAADQRRPALLESGGRAVDDSRFTYAVGRLSLWSPDPRRVAVDGASTLSQGNFHRLAIANPRLAPYGAAAKEVLEALGLADSLATKMVTGENVGHVYSMVATGGAELGFVSLSQVLTTEAARAGSRWDVPVELHGPIRQDAVLLDHGRANAAAEAFLRFLRGPGARTMIESFGYEVD